MRRHAVVDPDHVAVRRAIRVFVAMPTAFALSDLILNLGTGAVYTAFAVFSLTVFADFGGPMLRRARAFLLAGSAGLVLIAVGSVLAQNLWWAVAGAFVVGFGVFFVGALRAYFAAAAMPVLLPFVIVTTSGPGDLGAALRGEAGWAVGVTFATIAALVIWPARPHRQLEGRIAVALDAAAGAIRSLYPESPADFTIDPDIRTRELSAAFEQVQSVYFGRLARPGAANPRDRALMQLVDQVDRVRTLLRWQAQEPVDDFQPDTALARLSADIFEECAVALRESAATPDPNRMDDARVQHRDDLSTWVAATLGRNDRSAVIPRLTAGHRARMISAIAELACSQVQEAVQDRPTRVTQSTWDGRAVVRGLRKPTPAGVLRRHLTPRSPWFRNAARSAAAVSMATAVAGLTGVDHGFWVVLGAVAALRFDIIGTGRTVMQVLGGTIVGFVICVGLLVVLGESVSAYWVVLPFAVAAAAYTPTAVSFLVGQACFTIYLIVLFAIVLGPTLRTTEVRVMDVALGLIVSLAMSALLWPRGVVSRVLLDMRSAMQSAMDYMVAAYDELLEGSEFSDATKERNALAGEAAIRADETFDLALIQAGPESINARAWSLLAAAVTQLLAGARMITAYPGLGVGELSCPAVADTMLAAAHHIRAQLDVLADQLTTLADDRIVVVDELASMPPSGTDDGMLGNPLPRLHDHLATCVDSIRPPLPAHIASTVEVLVWAANWLTYFDWIVHRTARIQPIKESLAPEPRGLGRGRH